MKSALIGHTGFVGSTLKAQCHFDDYYRSGNISDMAGKRYDLIVCAGAPGQKWLANKHPEEDRQSLARLMDALGHASAGHVVLISTIDVYPTPIGVDEETPIQSEEGHPYGRHRLQLEGFVTARFEATVVRLPGLFGEGLKKNIIFDLLNDNMVDVINPRSVVQFYGLKSLWSDISKVRELGLPLVNFATEPVRVADLATEAFGRILGNPAAHPAVRYDMKTLHGHRLGGLEGYLQNAQSVMRQIEAFVESQRLREQ
tara:strand:+ start:3419 stop:4189 length:771 start_codon:yes stop_codon:yes gene_type:complete